MKIIAYITLGFILSLNAYSQNHNAPTADFSFEGVCLGDTTFFTNETYFGFSYQSTFGDSTKGIVDTSSLVDPWIIFDTVGVYSVKLVASNGHLSIIEKEVRIDTLPQSGISTQNYCLGGNTFFENKSSCEDSVHWKITTFNDRLIYTTNQHEFNYALPDSGWYKAQLIAFNQSGSDTTADSIYIFGPPIADFDFSGNCESPITLFSNTSTCADSINWWFGDSYVDSSRNTSIRTNAKHQYDSIGSYKVLLTVWNEFGKDTSSRILEIYDIPPIANFQYTAKGDSVFFSNNSINSSNSVWEFGDGDWSTEDNAIHEFPGEGEYEVVLSVYSNCFSARDTQLITIKNVGVSDYYKDLIVKLYPNPARSSITIDDFPENRNSIEWTIVNTIGTEVRGAHLQENKIDISELKPGMYVLKIIIDNKYHTSTFVKY